MRSPNSAPGVALVWTGLAASISQAQAFDVGELASALHGLGLAGWQGSYMPRMSNLEKSAKASNNTCVSACDILADIFPDIVRTQGSASYQQQEYTYWSNQQEETRPECRILPQSSADVAATLLVSQFTGCDFAVKSGGHACFSGASNIANAITIDLSGLNEVTVSSDQLTTFTGAGNRWIDVYDKLTPMNLSVIGGRVAAIGVGGLTLGGGISFFSGRYGWACDNVKNYEVVLANASTVNVNYTSHPDLYFALRGGGNNFGVVTRFDLDTFEQGRMWGGMVAYNISANESIYTAFENFANNAKQDPDAALITAVAYTQGEYIFGNGYEYAKPIVNPPIFHEFTAIQNLTSTMRISNMSDLALELNASNPGGFRETYTTATFKNSADLQVKILDLFVAEMAVVLNATGILPALVMQPITNAVLSSFSKNGGNALGISEDDGPLNLMNLAIMWSDPSDDDRILAAAQRVRSGAVTLAQGMGLDYKYIYQNYASLDQDVFAGYGAANRDRLIQISNETDPRQVFQRLQPGYFKLDGQKSGVPTR